MDNVKLLEKLFGQMKDNWGTWDNPFKNIILARKRNYRKTR